LVRAVGPGFHEAHHSAVLHTRRAAGARYRRHRARRSGRPGCACAVHRGTAEPMTDNLYRLTAISLDERTVVHRTRQIEQEREIAIYDLLEENSFTPVGSAGGPYRLVLRIEENRLVFDIHLEDDSVHGKV